MTVTMEAPVGEIPLSLKQISMLPDVQSRITYGTLRTYVVRYRDKGFPEPATRNAVGNGATWFASQIIFFLKHMPDNRGSKNHKDNEARAKLGHRNRELRKNAKCKECNVTVPAGDEYIEYMPANGTEIEIYDLVCAKIRGVWDGS